MYLNVELENNILASVVCDNKPQRYEIMVRLGVNENTFSTEMNKRAFRVMGELFGTGQYPDSLTIMSKDASLTLKMAELESSYTEPWNFEDNIKTLRNLEGARTFKAMAEATMATLAHPVEVTTIDVIENAVRNIDNTVAAIISNRTPRTIDDAVQDALDRMEKIIPPLQLFPAGTIANNAFHFYPGETMTIGARTGKGKTALACQFCNTMLESGLSGIYVCTESTDAEIMERLAAVDSGVPHHAVRGRNRLQDDTDKFRASLFKFRDQYRDKLTIIGVRRKKPNADDIVRAIKDREYRFGKPSFVVVDYIQDIDAAKSMMRMNKLERMEATVDIIHDCCIEHSCAVIFLSQLNRTGTPKERPTEDQIKAAGAIAEKSHIAAFLHRPGGEEEEAEFYSIKCRNTKMFDLRLKWERSKYVSPDNEFMPKRWQPAS